MPELRLTPFQLRLLINTAPMHAPLSPGGRPGAKQHLRLAAERVVEERRNTAVMIDQIATADAWAGGRLMDMTGSRINARLDVISRRRSVGESSSQVRGAAISCLLERQQKVPFHSRALPSPPPSPPPSPLPSPPSSPRSSPPSASPRAATRLPPLHEGVRVGRSRPTNGDSYLDSGRRASALAARTKAP